MSTDSETIRRIHDDDPPARCEWPLTIMGAAGIALILIAGAYLAAAWLAPRPPQWFA